MWRLWRHVRHFLYGVQARVGDGHFGLVAAGVAFWGMFAVFPGLAAVVAIWGMMADPQVISGYLEVAERFLPPDAGNLVHDQVMGLVNARTITLGWTTAASLMLALYSARNGVSALVRGLDVVHRAESRGWLVSLARDLLLTLALVAALLVALATVVIVPVVFSWLQLDRIAPRATRLLPWGAMFLLVLTCLSILYRFGPNVPRHGRAGWFSVGVVFAALGWAAVSLGFSLYLENFNSYNRIYGSIGAVIILMMWLYLSVWTVLVGGAINAELEARATMLRQMGRFRR